VHWNTGDLRFWAVCDLEPGELQRVSAAHDGTPGARARQQVVTARCAEATSNP